MALQQIDDDLLLADFGVSVSTGAVSGIGILDQNSELILQGQVVIVDHALTCKTELFGDLQYGNELTVADQYYKVIHEPLRFADGRFCIVPLERLGTTFTVFLPGVYVTGVFT